MITAGIDLGSQRVKFLILNDDQILSYELPTSEVADADGIKEFFSNVILRAGIALNDFRSIVATGRGGQKIHFSNRYVPDVVCDAVGANYLFPSARTIIDVGAESMKIIRCDEKGNVKNYTTNDRCAAGCGIFLEMMAKAMEIDLNEMEGISSLSESPVNVTSTCTVYSESEVITLVHKGVKKSDISKGICDSMSNRIFFSAKSFGIEREVVLTGGVMRNHTVIDSLRKLFEFRVLVPPNPQIVGALGAAILAKEDTP